MVKLVDLLFESEQPNPKIDRIDLDYPLQKGYTHTFIRFGKFGLGASKVQLGDEWKRETGKMLEPGLSVYFVTQMGDKWNVEPVDRRKASYQIGSSYFTDMVFDNFLPAIANDEVYIIRAELIPLEWVANDDAREETVLYKTYETGSDGEPVVEPNTIQIIKTLDTDEVLQNVIYNKWKPLGEFNGFGRGLLSDIVWDYCRDEDNE